MQGRPLVLHVRVFVEHLRYRRSVPRLPPPLDFNAVSFLSRLVVTLRLVYTLTGNCVAVRHNDTVEPGHRGLLCLSRLLHLGKTYIFI